MDSWCSPPDHQQASASVFTEEAVSFQWLVVNYSVAIGLANIDCARLMQTLFDGQDGHYSTQVGNCEFDHIYMLD